MKNVTKRCITIMVVLMAIIGMSHVGLAIVDSGDDKKGHDDKDDDKKGDHKKGHDDKDDDKEDDHKKGHDDKDDDKKGDHKKGHDDKDDDKKGHHKKGHDDKDDDKKGHHKKHHHKKGHDDKDDDKKDHDDKDDDVATLPVQTPQVVQSSGSSGGSSGGAVFIFGKSDIERYCYFKQQLTDDDRSNDDRAKYYIKILVWGNGFYEDQLKAFENKYSINCTSTGNIEMIDNIQ